jgi:hypothetical protein
MALSGDDIRLVFWVAVLPAFGAFALIAWRCTTCPAGRGAVRAPLSRAELARLPAAYWWVVGISAVFTLARFSEAFLVLRAQELGVALMWIPAVLVLMNVVYSLSSYPVGVLADRMHRGSLLGLGFAMLVAADLVWRWSMACPGWPSASPCGACTWA